MGLHKVINKNMEFVFNLISDHQGRLAFSGLKFVRLLCSSAFQVSPSFEIVLQLLLVCDAV
jgi:hypothetical protein